MNQDLINRLAVLTSLVKKSPAANLGRTAVMKLTYFLTVLRNVPLGYRFSLYSYGPFDSTVLQDVEMASNLQALISEPVRYPNGTGYVIRATESSADIETLGQEFVAKYREDIDWVLQEFGSMNAADLELTSTIVYVWRELGGSNADSIVRKVHEIKPHFSDERIRTKLSELADKQLINIVATR